MMETKGIEKVIYFVVVQNQVTDDKSDGFGSYLRVSYQDHHSNSTMLIIVVPILCEDYFKFLIPDNNLRLKLN